MQDAAIITVIFPVTDNGKFILTSEGMANLLLMTRQRFRAWRTLMREYDGITGSPADQRHEKFLEFLIVVPGDNSEDLISWLMGFFETVGIEGVFIERRDGGTM